MKQSYYAPWTERKEGLRAVAKRVPYAVMQRATKRLVKAGYMRGAQAKRTLHVVREILRETP